ncbi:MAG TPA: D-sedoheptulose 7-phosphate isomerase [Bacteroidales bacterium]|nr:D-sedoheptulose 7-phosphate isomerase [Bacteroidales bacterium]HSA43254.1 D-sedoheptulose 7-phosphate isomerase [Bacteroidales bacterium]
MDPVIELRIRESINTKERLLESSELLRVISDVAHACTNAFSKGNKVLFAGNGGSAADAQHLAAEFSGRFYYDRDPLYSEALHVNTSYLTAVANDYAFDQVYARLIKAKGREGDVFFAISTSGNSPNILAAIDEARKQHMTVIGMTGDTGGKMKTCCDYLINVPSTDTPRIQECHILIGHIICELVESAMFPR